MYSPAKRGLPIIVPEPATVLVMAAAGLPVLLRRRRRRSRNPELASGLELGPCPCLLARGRQVPLLRRNR